MQKRQTIIVGGGLAGLAAAAGLAAHSERVLLLESRPRLGGRASSILDRETETQIDNCQHVSMGCCTNFRYFCELTGLASDFRTEPELYFVGPDGEINRFRAGCAPAPFHLAASFRRLKYLSLSDKAAIARGLRQLATSPQRLDPSPARDDEPFDAWLTAARQPQTAIDRFWNVVLVSALSESLDRISVAHARKVFMDAFLAHRQGWEVQIPSVPLDRLYGGRLTSWLAERNAAVRLQSGVETLIFSGDRVRGVQLRNGETLTADDFVLAVPPWLVWRVLPAEQAQHPQVAQLEQLQAAPISSVHLWFDRPIMELPHAVLIDRLSHWVFNRSAVDESRHAYYQVVISASRELSGRSQDEVIAQVVAELAAIWPAAAEARLMSSRLITEHRAVFSPLPGVERLRPAQQSPWENLQWAGDWTATGWPATMEGAVRSGFLAAENILRRRGSAATLLQPDLPAARLSRWLFRLPSHNPRTL